MLKEVFVFDVSLQRVVHLFFVVLLNELGHPDISLDSLLLVLHLLHILLMPHLRQHELIVLFVEVGCDVPHEGITGVFALSKVVFQVKEDLRIAQLCSLHQLYAGG